MGPDELAAHFQSDMKHAVDRMIRDLNYRPTIFTRMVADFGAVGAAKRLLSGPSSQYGFEKLFENGRLAWSVEAHVILPWYRPLFTPEEAFEAEDRLSLVDFDWRMLMDSAPVPGWIDD